MSEGIVNKGLGIWLLYTFATLSIVACAADETTATGQLAVGLTTIGHDGAHYRFAAGAHLHIERVPNDYYLTTDIAVDGDAPRLVINLPVGPYTSRLLDEQGRTDRATLIRTNPDGTEMSVNVTADPPGMITVQEDTTASLVLHLHAQVIGELTFATGDVEVAIDLEATPSVVRIDLTATLHTTVSILTNDAPLPLAERLPAVNAINNINVTITSMGDWYRLGGDVVCTLVTAAATASPPLGGFVTQAFTEALTPEVCIYQRGPGRSAFSFTIGSVGPAADALLRDLGARDYEAAILFWAELDTPVFDGRTLRLWQLLTPRSANATANRLLAETQSGVSTPWLDATDAGLAMISLSAL